MSIVKSYLLNVIFNGVLTKVVRCPPSSPLHAKGVPLAEVLRWQETSSESTPSAVPDVVLRPLACSRYETHVTSFCRNICSHMSWQSVHLQFSETKLCHMHDAKSTNHQLHSVQA